MPALTIKGNASLLLSIIFFFYFFVLDFCCGFFYLIFTWVNNVSKVMFFNMITWFFVKYISMNIQWDINNVSTVFISMKTFEVENYWQIEFHMSCLLAKGYAIFLCMIILGHWKLSNGYHYTSPSVCALVKWIFQNQQFFFSLSIPLFVAHTHTHSSSVRPNPFIVRNYNLLIKLLLMPACAVPYCAYNSFVLSN